MLKSKDKVKILITSRGQRMHKEQLCKLQPSPQQKQWRPEDNGRAPLKLSERKKKNLFSPEKSPSKMKVK